MTDISYTALISQKPEHDILLHAMLCPSEASPCALIIDKADIDWNYLLGVAENHGLTPLLFTFLNKYHSSDTPGEITNIVHDRYRANELRNRVLAQELTRLLEQFKTKGIRALAYKGPTLTISVYDDIGLRQFGDLDILINTDDVAEACELLTKLDYKRRIPSLSPAREQIFIHMHHEHGFISSDQLVYVDLHWALSTRRFPFELEPAGLFERAEHITLANSNIEHISAQDMLLLLCMHISKDLWRKLVWICDIDRLVRTTNDIDWESLLQQSESSHCKRMLYLALLISNELLRTPVPDSILQAARTQSLVNQGQIALHLCLRDEIPDKNYRQCLAIEPFILPLCDTYTDRFRYVMRGLVRPSESDLIRFNLPAYLHFIYYFITPVRRLFFCTTRSLKRLIIG
jgi:hypothetical protein